MEAYLNRYMLFIEYVGTAFKYVGSAMRILTKIVAALRLRISQRCKEPSRFAGAACFLFVIFAAEGPDQFESRYQS
jgi:hypothetical protein